MILTTTYAQNEQGFFLNDWQPKEIELPNCVEAEKPTQAPLVTITVDYADTITQVCKYIYGNNANVWSSIMHNNSELVNNIINMNPWNILFPRTKGCS